VLVPLYFSNDPYKQLKIQRKMGYEETNSTLPWRAS